MENKITIKHLLNIQGVLSKIMGNTALGVKYIRALNHAIQVLTKNEVSLSTKDFSVSVEKDEDEGVIVDVFYIPTGQLVESFEINKSDIITSENGAEA